MMCFVGFSKSRNTEKTSVPLCLDFGMWCLVKWIPHFCGRRERRQIHGAAVGLSPDMCRLIFNNVPVNFMNLPRSHGLLGSNRV